MITNTQMSKIIRKIIMKWMHKIDDIGEIGKIRDWKDKYTIIWQTEHGHLGGNMLTVIRSQTKCKNNIIKGMDKIDEVKLERQNMATEQQKHWHFRKKLNDHKYAHTFNKDDQAGVKKTKWMNKTDEIEFYREIFDHFTQIEHDTWGKW